jgi:hypothetical protein
VAQQGHPPRLAGCGTGPKLQRQLERHARAAVHRAECGGEVAAATTDASPHRIITTITIISISSSITITSITRPFHQHRAALGGFGSVGLSPHFFGNPQAKKTWHRKQLGPTELRELGNWKQFCFKIGLNGEIYYFRPVLGAPAKQFENCFGLRITVRMP